MRRPRLLDLFSKAGGAGKGYARAGFDVVGVDIQPQPRYPFRHLTADAMAVLRDRRFLDQFDVVHASPPCQGYTTMSNRFRGKGGAVDDLPKLIAPVRDCLLEWGGIYVIENVAGARREMRNPIILSGANFGLGVHRPRLFESNAVLGAPPPMGRGDQLIGVYGDRPDGRLLNTRLDGTEQRAAASEAEAAAAMGVDWMTWDELREAIPPAYTEFIGAQLRLAVRRDETPPTPAIRHYLCGCGNPIEQGTNGRPRRHCSPRCRQAGYRRRLSSTSI